VPTFERTADDLIVHHLMRHDDVSRARLRIAAAQAEAQLND
jgi:hypothetical protein